MSSVVVPVFRGGARFRDCLNAVRLALRPDDELIVVANGVGKSGVKFADSMPKDIGEPHEDGQRDVALAQLIDQFFQIDADQGVLGWMHGDVAVVVQ